MQSECDGETRVLHLHHMSNITFHGRQGGAVFMRTLRRSAISPHATKCIK